jgi:2-polyprenyl-6-methoxyphenol hydroxylase-like FAD-dependent oxidoreductase
LLVCADGAQSPTRRRLLPDVQPIYAGYVAWRGTLDEADGGQMAFDDLAEGDEGEMPVLVDLSRCTALDTSTIAAGISEYNPDDAWDVSK